MRLGKKSPRNNTSSPVVYCSIISPPNWFCGFSVFSGGDILGVRGPFISGEDADKGLYGGLSSSLRGISSSNDGLYAGEVSG